MEHATRFAGQKVRWPLTVSNSMPIPNAYKRSVMLLGSFDGMHVGHQVLASEARRIATARGVPLAVLQCDPHPRMFFSNGSFRRVSTGTAQLELLAAALIELVYSPKFDLDFANTTPEQFVERDLVSHLDVSCVVVGRDFRFGRRRTGDVSLLRRLGQQYNFDVVVLEDHTCDGHRVSTSSIRTAIAEGDIETAEKLLGHKWLTEIRFSGDCHWNFAPDQILPLPSAYPIVALDRFGNQLCRAEIHVSHCCAFRANLPHCTAMLEWSF